MRTYTNTSFTNRNVFGLSQDRVVVSSRVRALMLRSISRGTPPNVIATRFARLARRVLGRGHGRAAQMAMHLCLAITGPLWQPVRLMSPVLVVA